MDTTTKGTRTKYRLAEAMKECMKTTPVDNITVTQLTELCGVTRQTFYRNFIDKYDLINWIFYTEFVSNIHLEEYKDALQLLEDICDYLYQERDFYRVALKMEGQNSFQEYFSEVMDPYLKYLADQIMGVGKEEAFFLRFFGDAFLMAIIRWVMDENIMQPREFVRQLDETISLGAKKILEVKQKKAADSSVL